MSRPKTRAAAAAIAAAVVLIAGVARAQMGGVVTAITTRNIIVSDTAYALSDDTSFQDMTGHPIAASEVRRGVVIELEFDGEGRLTVVRASVVR